jgi:putative PIN family toxin of toxin-antitoxin system
VRAVLDTVVFVRALINPRSVWGRLAFEVEGYTLVLSPEIIGEILEVAHRSELRERFPQLDDVRLERALSAIEKAEIVEPTEAISVCRDPKDNKFFECAVAGRADYIVSEDRDILDVGEYRGVKTVTAAQLLDMLRGPPR